MSDKKEGKVIASLVKSYSSLVSTGDAGVRAWYRSAVKVSVLDFEATIEEAKKVGEVRGITKNSAKFVPVIVRIFDIEGGDKVSVIEVCKVAEVAQRALKSDGALALAGMVKDFEEFKSVAVDALEKKLAGRPARPGAGRRAASAVEESLNADGVILKALDALQEMEDLTITNFDAVDALVKLLNASAANSRSLLAKSVERHPAKGAAA
jgi:hypothetical protein